MQKPLLKLFVAPTCPFCHRAELAAHEKKIPYERVLISLSDIPQWYKEINPRETVPTLEVGEKQYVFESNLIAQYFDRAGSPAGSLMGANPVQRHKIDFFMGQVGDFTMAAHDVLRDPFNAEKRKALDDNAAYVDKLFAQHQKTGPYFFDDVFTMADVAVLPFLIRLKPALMYYAGCDVFEKAPNMKRMWAAALERPSVKETMISPEMSIQHYRHFAPESSPIFPANGGFVMFYNRGCPFVDRARIACAVKKFPAHMVHVDLHPEPEWYCLMNRREMVPFLITPQGEAIHESNLIVNFVDDLTTEGKKLFPHDDAQKEYQVAYFVNCVGDFTGAMYGFTRNPTGKDEKEELVWAAGELEKLLAAKPNGEGPFHGGSAMDAADIAALPMLVRLQAYTPELTGGFDLFAQFPLLKGLLTAGRDAVAPYNILLSDAEYLSLKKGK